MDDGEEKKPRRHRGGMLAFFFLQMKLTSLRILEAYLLVLMVRSFGYSRWWLEICNNY
jgi:hypothetical protein